MKKILPLLILVYGIGFSQSNVVLNKEGVAPIVTEVEGKSAEELYLKTKEWVQVNYKNPSEVLKADIKNDMIRINGYSKNFFFIKSILKNYYDVEYTIEFLFKEGKYKYIFTIYSVKTQGKNVYFSVPSDFFKSDGTTVRSAYADGYESLLESLQNLYKSHFNYVTGKEKKEDW